MSRNSLLEAGAKSEGDYFAIADYRCIIYEINEAINLLQNADFTKKSGTL